MSSRDYYDILGLTPEADGTTVNRAYWHMARKYQALAVSDPRAHHMLDDLNEAYAVLGTSRLRDEYDASRSESDGGAAPSGQGKPPVGRRAQPLQRAPSNRPATKPSARESVTSMNSWLPYAAAGSIAAAAAIAGGLSGNVMLMALGASGGLALVAGFTRHKVASTWRERRTRDGESHATSQPATPKERAVRAGAPSATRRREVPVDELQLSTASMVGRWRSSLARPEAAAREPDSTLVDIFQSERDVETHAEPLSAVLDILRGDHHTVESR